VAPVTARRKSWAISGAGEKPGGAAFGGPDFISTQLPFALHNRRLLRRRKIFHCDKWRFTCGNAVPNLLFCMMSLFSLL
jgi:hypothetical protein